MIEEKLEQKLLAWGFSNKKIDTIYGIYHEIGRRKYPDNAITQNRYASIRTERFFIERKQDQDSFDNRTEHLKNNYTP